MRLGLTERAYAKINLFLEITGKRPDGYHTLESVMQTVSLWDEVRLLPGEEPGLRFSCDDPTLPTDESNLAVRAYRAFFRRGKETGRYREPDGACLTLTKRIPHAAGLGGGSSDAAAVLRLLNRSLGSPCTEEELCRIGAELGADIPFCVMGGTRMARGIGERLSPLPPPPADLRYVIGRGREGMSTPRAYALLDETPFVPVSSEPIRRALADGDAKALPSLLFNRFDTVVTGDPAVRAILTRTGARTVLLSGSGTAVIGVYDDPAQAENACHILREEGKFGAVTEAVTPLREETD